MKRYTLIFLFIILFFPAADSGAYEVKSLEHGEDRDVLSIVETPEIRKELQT
ncbi:MAG: hypothetical protein HQ566_00985, partial [Candidatus Omnitrophica bacterium]|nr:hypothetical protein [Candidatus Omnitrophota bacterium]